MARISLQIKGVASLLLSTIASISAAVTMRRFFEHTSWTLPAISLALALGCQMLLLFVESKEEEELSLLRKQRLERGLHSIEERRKITLRIQQEIESGTIEAAAKWQKFREKLND